VERSHIMRTNIENHFKAYLIFLIIGLGILSAAITPCIGANLSASQDETEYSMVKGVGNDYLTTTDGRFVITKDTKIYDENGSEKRLSDIKVSSIVRIAFKRTGGQLISSDIVIKTTGIKIIPE